MLFSFKELYPRMKFNAHVFTQQNHRRMRFLKNQYFVMLTIAVKPISHPSISLQPMSVQF